jgi:parallel beta-helix repeat protein
MGIELQENSNNISGNRIRRCEFGIQFEGADNIVYGNDIDSCPVGIQYYGRGNIITKNNFKNYSQIGFWFSRWFGEQFFLRLNSIWISNYWDTWIGFGPKIILGLQAIAIGYISVIPGFEFDMQPAREPYDIPISNF